ncbi:putative RNA pseudouridine synthase [Campylobacterota bacterium]|nr:putative RNA pseudouridine synthase [Campylobacterota bacterium]
MRADRFAADQLNIGRNEAAQLIKNGFVSGASKPSDQLKTGEIVTITLPEQPAQSQKPPIDFDIEILYEDDNLLVINKPAGAVVHSAPSYKGATVVDWLNAHGITLSTMAGENRAGIVHRIDKETTGALAIAKTNAAHRDLSRQLQERTMGRYYLAVIDRALKNDCVVDVPIARNPRERTKMAVVSSGRAAKSAFISLAALDNGMELIACKLFSGRTHQIRVHLAHISRHIAGDTLYGYKPPTDKIVPILLHAYMLYLRCPQNGKIIRVSAPLSPHFAEFLNVNLHKEKIDELLQTSRIERSFDAFLGVRPPA